jgi:hypothetical protein
MAINAETLMRDVHSMFTRYFGEHGALLLTGDDGSTVEVAASDPFNNYQFFFTIFAGEADIEVDAGYMNTKTDQTIYVPDTYVDPKAILKWLEGAVRKFHGNTPLTLRQEAEGVYSVRNESTGAEATVHIAPTN